MSSAFVGSASHKISVVDLLADSSAILLDVRTTEEAETVKLDFVHHLTSLNIPLHCLPDQFKQISAEKRVGIFCPHSVRAAVAYTYLRTLGYDNVYVIEGGYAALVEEARPGKVLAKVGKR
ncbi:MAG: hypothetical protein B6I36_10625 [Desulfobacteraceae bacterium 4572_35.1]|nr:MAG: hypothetical protein B6I36_10625 [Desulfobacteraceae bacterium 4572_35.1]